MVKKMVISDLHWTSLGPILAEIRPDELRMYKADSSDLSQYRNTNS